MFPLRRWGVVLTMLPGVAIHAGEQEEWLAYTGSEVQRLKAHNRELPAMGRGWFEVVEGVAPVLLSAPHTTSHMREGRLKASDAGTGGLAMLLNKITSAPVLLTTWAAPSDPNFTEPNAYKDELARQVTKRKPLLVLDLHAAAEGRPFDVDFGTMHGASLQGKVALLDQLKDCLRKAGVEFLTDNVFPAKSQATVTRFLSGRKVVCIQLEINRAFLHPELGGEDAKRYLALVRGLSTFISQVKEK